MIGVDNFDPFYPEPRKRAQPGRRPWRTRGSGWSSSTSATRRRSRRVVRRGRPDAIVHLAARAGVRPSIDDPPLYAAVNVRGRSTCSRRPAGSSPGPGSSTRRARASTATGPTAPFRETDPVDLPGQPLRGDQEGVRAAGPHVPPPARPARDRPPVLHRVRAREPPRPGDRQVRPPDRPGRARPDVRRRHDPPRLHVRRRHRRRHRPRRSTVARRTTCTTSATPTRSSCATMIAAMGEALGKAPIDRAPARAARRRPPDLRRHLAAPRPSSATHPRTPFREGLARFVAWFRDSRPDLDRRRAQAACLSRNIRR